MDKSDAKLPAAQDASRPDTVASVLAELAAYGPFLPGSVRKTTQKGRPRKDGSRKTYPSSPIFTWTDPASGRQRSKRIPPAAFPKAKALCARYAGARALLKRLLAAAAREAMDGLSKKTSDARSAAAPRAHGGGAGRSGREGARGVRRGP